MSITRISEFQAKPDQSERLDVFLRSLVPELEALAGCESCRLLRGHDDPAKFIMLEVWASKAAHQESLKNIPAESFAEVMQMLAAQPSGAYYTT